MANRCMAGLLIASFAAVFAAEAPFIRAAFLPDSAFVRKVEPEYPAAALAFRAQGTVRLQVTFGTDGTAQRLRVLSGHPLLAGAARRAVRQWVIRPPVVGGQSAAVITQVEVEFRLDERGRPLRPPGASAAPTT